MSNDNSHPQGFPTPSKQDRPSAPWAPRRKLADGTILVLEGTEDEDYVFVADQDGDNS